MRGKLKLASNPKAMVRRLTLAAMAFLCSTAIVLLFTPAEAQNYDYREDDPDLLFAEVYGRLGITIPERVARDSTIWLSLDILRREPCDQKAVDKLADALDKYGYRRQAADSLSNFVRKCGGPATALHKSVDIFLKLYDYGRAVEVADDFIRIAPTNYDAWYLRGVATDGLGNHQYAVTDFANAIELFAYDRKSISSNVFTNMAKAYAGLGQFCEAMSSIQTWVALDPVARDNVRSQRIVADYAEKGSCNKSLRASKERFPLRGQARVVVVKAELNGVKGTFILDTGASYVSVTSGFATRAKMSQPEHSLIQLQTANGKTPAILTNADSIKLGSLESKSVPVVVLQKADALGKEYDGLLGMSFLSQFEIQMANGFIEVRTRGAAKLPSTPTPPTTRGR